MTPEHPRSPGIYLMTCMENNYEPGEIRVCREPFIGLWAELSGVSSGPIKYIHDGLTDIMCERETSQR